MRECPCSTTAPRDKPDDLQTRAVFPPAPATLRAGPVATFLPRACSPHFLMTPASLMPRAYAKPSGATQSGVLLYTFPDTRVKLSSLPCLLRASRVYLVPQAPSTSLSFMQPSTSMWSPATSPVPLPHTPASTLTTRCAVTLHLVLHSTSCPDP